MEEVQRLLSHIGQEGVVDEVEDKIFRMDTKDGFFSVKSIYKALQPRSIEPFPWRMVGKSDVQQKICFFT